MSESIVHIESLNQDNKGFGTGFVIESNEQGTYILTCKHVLDTVENASIESHPIEIISDNDLLDMAIIFLPLQYHPRMTLQLRPCHNLHVTSIAFSNFKENLVQKSTIHATLFEDFIELHSTEDDAYYLIKKIKADKDYVFSKGNSGAPIICDETGHVIAMLCNKEGSRLAYAIGVSSMKKLLEQLYNNQALMKIHRNFYLKMSSFKHEVSSSIQTRKNPKNRAIYHINELKRENSTLIQSLKQKFSKAKYFFLGILSILALYGAYSFFMQAKAHTNEYYHISNIPTDETLNVREGAGQGYKIIDELLPQTNHITVLHCKNNDEGIKWCYIKHQNLEGWVHSYYIKKTINMNSH